MSVSKIIGQPIQIAVNEDYFYNLVNKFDVYVDKTLFIKEVLDSSEKAMLITYPRRWGKTLNLDMLKVFFQIENINYNKNKEKDESFFYSLIPDFFKAEVADESTSKNKKLFTDHNLKITQVSNGQYMQYQGGYPVIFITLKDIKGNSVKKITEQLKILVKELFGDFRYLKNSDELCDDEKDDFKKYIDMQYDGIRLEDSIKFLSKLLYIHHKQKVYVLVDEYDTPVSWLLEQHLGEALNLRLPENVSQLISQMFCSSISKTNPYLEKLILTGVFDTTYKGTTAGCNNIRSYGISDKRFSESFGFTTEEVKMLIGKLAKEIPFYDKEKVFNIIKDWYGGYFVPIVAMDSSSIDYITSDSKEAHNEVFTPWAVMSFLHDSFRNRELLPRSYWSKTGYKTILERLFTQEKCKNSSLSRKFLEISKNVSYELNFDNQISLFKYDWHSDIDNEAFFSHLLLNSGYLASKEFQGEFKFTIPNKELLLEFTSIIPKDNKNCGKILENLQKNRQLEILNMIRKNDSSEDFIDEFENKFTTYKINCADNSMNFNFISLATIYSNKKIYESLKTHCSNESLNVLDKANGYTALDYANTLQRSFVDHSNNTKFHHYNVPGSFYYLICSVCTNDWGELFIKIFKSFGPFMIVSSIVKLLDQHIHRFPFFEQHTKTKNIVKGFVLFLSFVPGVIMGDYLPTKEYCQEYTYYQQTNISAPREFTELKHFEKYINIYGNSPHIVVDEACNNKEDKITEIVQPIFQNPYLVDEKIKFTLCQPKISQQTKSSNNVIEKEHPQCTKTNNLQEHPTCEATEYPQKELSNNEEIGQEELVHSKTDQTEGL